MSPGGTRACSPCSVGGGGRGRTSFGPGGASLTKSTSGLHGTTGHLHVHSHVHKIDKIAKTRLDRPWLAVAAARRLRSYAALRYAATVPANPNYNHPPGAHQHTSTVAWVEEELRAVTLTWKPDSCLQSVHACERVCVFVRAVRARTRVCACLCPWCARTRTHMSVSSCPIVCVRKCVCARECVRVCV